MTSVANLAVAYSSYQHALCHRLSYNLAVPCCSYELALPSCCHLLPHLVAQPSHLPCSAHCATCCMPSNISGSPASHRCLTVLCTFPLSLGLSHQISHRRGSRSGCKDVYTPQPRACMCCWLKSMYTTPPYTCAKKSRQRSAACFECLAAPQLGRSYHTTDECRGITDV